MEIKNLCKAYGDLPVLENVSFTAGVGVTALWGPSGVGKTTLLRILLGLEKPDSGELMGMAVRWSAVFQEDRLLEDWTPWEISGLRWGRTTRKRKRRPCSRRWA